MPKLLLTLVGGNPASSLVSARVIQPDQVLLIGTRQTRAKAEALQGQVGCPSRIVELEADMPLEVFADQLDRPCPLEAGWQLCADVTGGTTAMKFGLYHFLQTRHPEAQLVNLEQKSYLLMDLRTGERLHEEPVLITPSEMLAWNGVRPLKVVWEGSLVEIPKEIRQRAAVGAALLKAMGAGKYRNLDPKQGNCVEIDAGFLPKQLPKGFSYSRGRLYSDCKGYLQSNSWLEEYALFLAWEELRDQGDRIAAWLGATVKSGSQGQDESDVVLVRGSRCLVIEAKARRERKKAGADLFKRVAKTAENFGSHARVLMFHPAWGKGAPQGLKDLAGDRTELVGADISAFKQAVRKVLG